MLTRHRAESTATLGSALASALAIPLIDPLAPEVIAVPARGVERWLTQQLAEHLGTSRPDGNDGVAANIDFRLLADLMESALSSIRGYHRDDDPWSRKHLPWSVLRVIDDQIAEPEYAMLAAHLGVSGGTSNVQRRHRRYRTARHIATLFDNYGQSRPFMLTAWAAGEDHDGFGESLSPDTSWQPHLWRAVRASIGVPPPAEQLNELCRQLVAQPDLIELPERISIFGPTSVAYAHLQVLAALAENRAVDVYMPHPSHQLLIDQQNNDRKVFRRSDIPQQIATHPLLASLARESFETVLSWSRIPGVDRWHDRPPSEATTVLSQLQHCIAANSDHREKQDLDGSFAIHSCHGPTRQVEVARDVLVAMFADDPTLEPREVIIMCPDVEVYAPLIHAAFGRDTATHPAHQLRVRLADRALTATNPVLDLVLGVIGLAGGRVTATDVMDLFARQPVRRLFGFNDEAIDQMSQWLVSSNMRWGLGEHQRATFGLAQFPQNTMATSLDRIAAGVAIDETSGWLGRVLPLGDVDGTDIELVGAMGECVARLSRCIDALTPDQPTEQWCAHLIDVVDSLADTSATDSWQIGAAVSSLRAAFDNAGTQQLSRLDVIAILEDMVAARPTRANFASGELTVCSMVPMRTIPHRAIIVIGIDDDAFPRVIRPDGDDILARNPVVGERDPRSRDRQMLLDTIMSATEKLVLCYTGSDPITGLRRPPAVPVSDVIDAVTAHLVPAAADALVTRHPLHGFHPSLFRADAPFSFDSVALAGARSLVGAQRGPIVFDRTPLLPPAPSDIDVAELIAFFEHPIRGFCRQRLGFSIPEPHEALTDELLPTIDGLTQWGIGERLLRGRLRGVEIADLRAAELRRGALPPFNFGQDALASVIDNVGRIYEACSAFRDVPAGDLDVDVQLTVDGMPRRIVGTIDDIYRVSGETGQATELRDQPIVFRPSYSRMSARRRLGTWIAMCVAAASSGVDVTGVSIGRAARGRRISRVEVRTPGDPTDVLVDLIRIRDEGLCRPLPLPTEAAAEYAQARAAGRTHDEGLDAATANYTSTYGESTDRYNTYVFGVDFTDLGDLMEFARLSARVWKPLLDNEEMAIR